MVGVSYMLPLPPIYNLGIRTGATFRLGTLTCVSLVEHPHSECFRVLVKPFKCFFVFVFLALSNFKFSVLNLWARDTQPTSSNLAIGTYSNKRKYWGRIYTMTFLTWLIQLVLGLAWVIFCGGYILGHTFS